MLSSAEIFALIFPGTARVNSLLATAYISLFPNLLLAFVPPDINPTSLNTLVSFAVGGLLGDVFLHLLPHSFLGEHQEAGVTVVVDERKNVIIGLGIFFGLMFFFVMDKGMRVLSGGDGHGHSHSHSHGDEKKHDHDHDHPTPASTSSKNVISDGLRNRKPTSSTEPDPINALTKADSPSGGVKLSAYLNLFADATHNFTDGLAIAASFYSSPSIGATTFVAVFFHEIPHEVGDYAILIQSGFSKPRAMLAQFGTAVGAFLGTLAGIAIEEASRSTTAAAQAAARDAGASTEGLGLFGTDATWADLVIPVTAGGFLYIATVGVIPEVLEVSGKLRKDARQFASEIVAMLVGVGMMAVIAWSEASGKE